MSFLHDLDCELVIIPLKLRVYDSCKGAFAETFPEIKVGGLQFGGVDLQGWEGLALGGASLIRRRYWSGRHEYDMELIEVFSTEKDSILFECLVKEAGLEACNSYKFELGPIWRTSLGTTRWFSKSSSLKY